MLLTPYLLEHLSGVISFIFINKSIVDRALIVTDISMSYQKDKGQLNRSILR
ncbi:MAG: hypothetical protein BMS9Abin02_1621 [Anaerolineae bacterium]|nr:MAG: hypothetical protein BMS9Abin02_1621 [Anaerolineae bacterium]